MTVPKGWLPSDNEQPLSIHVQPVVEAERQAEAEAAAEKESESEADESAVVVYDERLHFRYFVTYNRLVWIALFVIAILSAAWLWASNVVSNFRSTGPLVTPVEADPTDEIARKIGEAINIIVSALVDAITKFIQQIAGGTTVSVGNTGWSLALIVFVVLTVMTLRSLIVWSRSRLLVNEEGVRLVEPDIPWLLATGSIQNLSPNIVNDVAKKRDLWDQLIFWTCWHASILCDEQAGRTDEVQNVPVRDVKRLEEAVRSLAEHHSASAKEGEKTTNELLAEAVKELKLLRGVGEA